MVAGHDPRALWLSGVCSANQVTRIPQGNLILTDGDFNRSHIAIWCVNEIPASVLPNAVSHRCTTIHLEWD